MRKTLNVCEQKFDTKNLIRTAIVPKIVESLGHVYPELEKHSQCISDMFEFENELLKVAIENNRKNFKLLKIPLTSSIKEDDTVNFSNFSLAYRDVEKQIQLDKNLKTLPVEFVFDKLYTTYGLSDELIQKLADEKNLTIDLNEFKVFKLKKRQEAKSQHQIAESSILDKAIQSNAPPTDYQPMYDYVFDSQSRQFVVNPLEGKVVAIEHNQNDNSHHIILDKTNFYHTAGGQDGDIGRMTTDVGTFDVKNVTIHKGYVVHTGHFLDGTKPFQLNDRVNLFVDSMHRTQLSQHHTAMHLLQAAMRTVTNRIVFQESSHVSASHLKCQFGAIGKRISLDQLEDIQDLVCKVIKSKISTATLHVAAHELYAMNNLTTLPGATYPDNDIRVLRVEDAANGFESIEPCCGTHVRNTSQLDDFCFTSLKVNNSSSYHMTAVAGRLVESIKLKEKQFRETYASFVEKMRLDESSTKAIEEWEALELEANEIKRKLFDGQLSYIMSARIIPEMDAFEKTIRTGKRAQIRQSMITDILDALATRKYFLVHVLETKNPLDDMLLAEAEQMCNDLPVILLNISNNRIVNGRASIPLKYTDRKFDAKVWLNELVGSLKIKCSSKHKNGSSRSTLTEIPNHFIEPQQFDDAMQRTNALAMHMFSRAVSADEKTRLVQKIHLQNEILDIRSKIKKAKNLDDMINIVAVVTSFRNEIKGSMYSYELKSTCLAELAEINDQIIDAQHEVEK